VYPKDDEIGRAHSTYKRKVIHARFCGKTEGMGSLGRPGHRWEESIEMDPK
jgi:hypothetical protein